jgi:hypothetical protein
MSQYVSMFNIVYHYVNIPVTLQFLIVYINVVKCVLVVRLALAGTNEMCHGEFNRIWLDLPRMNKETQWIVTLG